MRFAHKSAYDCILVFVDRPPGNLFLNASKGLSNFPKYYKYLRPPSTRLPMDPQQQIPTVPTQYAVRPLLPPPPPVVLPLQLTDILLESFPPPIALTPLKPTRAGIPTRARARRARTPALAHTPARDRTPARARPRAGTEPLPSPLTTPEPTPEPSCAEQDTSPIKRPPNATISDVKSLFAKLYPDLEALKQDAHYTQFRVRPITIGSPSIHTYLPCVRIASINSRRSTWITRWPSAARIGIL